MATAKKKEKKAVPERVTTIDPYYKKYCQQVLKTMASDEFYRYFMKVVSTGKNVYQFSNRQVEKTVDETWVAAIEACIPHMQAIINNPRNFIVREEIIVNVALSKKVEAETIRHLCSHGNMIDEVNGDSVRPNRLLEITKEDSINTYENKFVYTVLEMAWDFVDMRYEAIFANMGDEFGSHLRIESDSYATLENVKATMDIKIQQNEDIIAADDKSNDIFARIARIHRNLASFRSTPFAKQMAKYGKIKPPLVKTNAIKKNPHFKGCQKLWDFILMYRDVGYKIETREQSSEIDDEFLTDIYNSIIFNYTILKHHLEDKKDRLIDPSKPIRKKETVPRFIKDIIEEPVTDPDMHFDEVKRVLVEKVTKQDLLKLEAEERRRLIEEQEAEEKAKKAEEERLRREEEKARKEAEAKAEAERKKEEARKAREERAAAAEAEREAFRKAAAEQDFLEGMNAAIEGFQKGRADYVKKRTAEKAAEAARREKEEKERIAAEKKEAARQAALKKAEEERIAAEKKAEEDRRQAELAAAENAAEAARLTAEKAAAERAVAENTEVVDKLRAEKEKAVAAAEKKKAEAEHIAESAKAEKEAALAALAEAKKKADIARAARADAVARRNAANSEVEENNKAIAEAEAEKTAAEEAIADARKQLKEKQKQAAEAQEKAEAAIADAKSAKDALDADLATAQNALSEAEAQNEALRQQIEEAEARRQAALQEAVEKAAAIEAQKAAEEAEKAAKKNRWGGFFKK